MTVFSLSDQACSKLSRDMLPEPICICRKCTPLPRKLRLVVVDVVGDGLDRLVPSGQATQLQLVSDIAASYGIECHTTHQTFDASHAKLTRRIVEDPERRQLNGKAFLAAHDVDRVHTVFVVACDLYEINLVGSIEHCSLGDHATVWTSLHSDTTTLVSVVCSKVYDPLILCGSGRCIGETSMLLCECCMRGVQREGVDMRAGLKRLRGIFGDRLPERVDDLRRIDAWLADPRSLERAPDVPPVGQLEYHTEPVYYEKVLDLDSTRADAWHGLAGRGGGRVSRRHYTSEECEVRALRCRARGDASLSREDVYDCWLALGQSDGGRVAGRTYSAVDCLHQAIESADRDGSRSVAWFVMGRDAGGSAEHTARQCFERAAELDDKDFDNWYYLAVHGGGTVGAHARSRVECLELAVRALDATPNFRQGSWGEQRTAQAVDCWAQLARAEDGRTISKKECARRALEIDPGHRAERSGDLVLDLLQDEYTPEDCEMIDAAQRAAWTELGRAGGGKIRGVEYDARQCISQALAIAPDSPEALFLRGRMGGGDVGGETLDARQCFQRALGSKSTEPTYVGAIASRWAALGRLGGGEVLGVFYRQVACYERALSSVPRGDVRFSDEWCALGLLGGGQVDGEPWTAKQCLEHALVLEPRDRGPAEKLASMRAEWIVGQSRARPAHPPLEPTDDEPVAKRVRAEPATFFGVELS